jgi:hypothetical protein
MERVQRYVVIFKLKKIRQPVAGWNKTNPKLDSFPRLIILSAQTK